MAAIIPKYASNTEMITRGLPYFILVVNIWVAWRKGTLGLRNLELVTWWFLIASFVLAWVVDKIFTTDVLGEVGTPMRTYVLFGGLTSIFVSGTCI